MSTLWTEKSAGVMICLCVTLVSYMPLVYGHVAFVEARISRHDIMFFVVLPFLSLAVMVAAIFVVHSVAHAGHLFSLNWIGANKRLDILGAVVLSVAFVVIDGAMRHILGLSYVVSGRIALSSPLSTLPLSLYVLRFVVVTPFVEEVFWRGYVQDSIERASNSAIALLSQAALFAALHLRNLGETGTIFLFALALGYWRSRRRTLLPLIAAHTVVNLVGMVPFVRNNAEWRSIKIVRDYRTSLEELGMRAGYTVDGNADSHYARAFEWAIGVPSNIERSDLRIWPTDLPPMRMRSLRNWICLNEKAVTVFEEGTQKPYWVRNYRSLPFADVVTPPFERKAREMVTVLLLKTKVSETDAPPQQSISDLIACYRFGLHLMGPKPLNEQVLGLETQEYVLKEAFKILLRRKTDATWLACLQSQVEEIPWRAAQEISFSGQRLICHDIIQRSFTCDQQGHGHMPRWVIMQMIANRRNARYGIEPWERLERKVTADLVDTLLTYLDSISRRTPAELLQAGELIGDVVGRMAHDNVFLLTQADRLEDYYYWCHECDARRDALVVIAALMRYYMETDEFPWDLNELVTRNYIRAVPRDPFSGSPLVYEKIGRDFVLYSLGADFDDDGGVSRRRDSSDADGDDVFWPTTDDH